MWLHTYVQYGVDTLVPRVQCKLTSTITCIDCTGIEMITDYDHAKTLDKLITSVESLQELPLNQSVSRKKLARE